MRRIAVECPTDWAGQEWLEATLSKFEFEISTDPEVLIVNPGTTAPIDRKVVDRYPNLRIIATPSTGTNHIIVSNPDIEVISLLDDRDALRRITASSEFTWLHLMNALRKFTHATKSVLSWRSSQNESALRSHQLSNTSLTIIGLGRIGKNVASYARAFKMQIDAAIDPTESDDDIPMYRSIIDYAENCPHAFRSNAYVVCVNLSNLTYGLINRTFIDALKTYDGRLPIMVNTSRGEVIDEHAVADAVINDRLIFSCDVMRYEQDRMQMVNGPLWRIRDHENMTITPHVAGATYESQMIAFETAVRLAYERL